MNQMSRGIDRIKSRAKLREYIRRGWKVDVDRGVIWTIDQLAGYREFPISKSLLQTGKKKKGVPEEHIEPSPKSK